MRRLAWSGTPDWRAEVCEVVLSDDGLAATGAQLGAAPMPYRAAYELEVRGDWATRRLRVDVEDRSSALPRRRDAGESGVSGRGLMLVDRLADVWGVESRGSGKCVWCEFLIPDRS